jgi:hypothetical protein
MRDLTKAIISLYPGAQWVLNGDDYSGLDWLPGNTVPKPTLEELETECDRLQAEWEAKQYQRDRAKEYPSLTDQMDMQYWDKINGTTTWADAIQAVKDKYPKP